MLCVLYTYITPVCGFKILININGSIARVSFCIYYLSNTLRIKCWNNMIQYSQYLNIDLCHFTFKLFWEWLNFPTIYNVYIWCKTNWENVQVQYYYTRNCIFETLNASIGTSTFTSTHILNCFEITKTLSNI